MDSQIAVQIPTILPKQSISLNFMPLNEMYKITTKSDNNWGIAGYQVPKRYFDHIKTIQDRIFEEMRVKGKFEKSMKKVTKRGCYLDDEFKLHKITPGPQKYDVSYKWSNPAEIESGKKKPKDTKKNTYIDEIINNSKRNIIPGIGKYNLMKTDEEIKKQIQNMQKKIKPSPRGNYLNDCEYIGDLLPGPGNYNPRPILPKIKINNTKPEQWRQKHKELEQKKQKKYNTPDMGTYKYNYPSTYDTFGKIYQKLQDSGGKLTKSAVNYLGKTERFKDISKSKSKQITNAPGPGHYPLIAQWPGKESKKEQFNYLEKISKGIEKSIYYENS